MKNKLYYMPEWNVLGIVSKEVDGYVLLVTSELEEKSNIFRVLTNKWILIGEI